MYLHVCHKTVHGANKMETTQQITTEVNKNKTQTEEKMSEGNDFDPATIFRKAAPIAAIGIKIQPNSLASWAENMKCTCNRIDKDSCAFIFSGKLARTQMSHNVRFLISRNPIQYNHLSLLMFHA